MKAVILEIFELSNRVILIAEFEKNDHLRAGIYIISKGVHFRILSIGVKRNLVNNPKYSGVLNERNIVDFDIATSQDTSMCLAVGMTVDVVTSGSSR